MQNRNKQGIIKGLILEIQRMSTEDGPGIRTTVFLKGCSLKCIWCHNPESILLKPQVQWINTNCIDCKICICTCKNNALTATSSGIQIDTNLCRGCGKCADECPSKAMDILGIQWSADDLIDEVIKDKAYFEQSGGGITVSGGETTVQAEFACRFLKGLKEKGIHTALDTNGQCTKEALDKLLPYADLILYDLKEIKPDKHKEFTAHSNTKILKNIKHVSSYIRSNHTQGKLWIRTPIIPDATAREDNIQGIGDFIEANLNGIVTRWELCAFNHFCRGKYKRLGLDWVYKKSDLLPRKVMKDLADVAKSSGVDPEIVHWSGPTKDEDQDEPAIPLRKEINSC